MQIGDGIAGRLQGSRGKGHTAGGLRPDADGVIDKVRGKPGVFNLLNREIAGELMNDSTDHFQVGQLLSPYLGEIMSHGCGKGHAAMCIRMHQEAMTMWKKESHPAEPVTAQGLYYWRRAVLLTLREEGLLDGEAFHRVLERLNKLEEETAEWEKE